MTKVFLAVPKIPHQGIPQAVLCMVPAARCAGCSLCFQEALPEHGAHGGFHVLCPVGTMAI